MSDLPDVPNIEQAVIEAVRGNLSVIVTAIVRHHKKNPDHGVNCACMDEYIRLLCTLTTTGDADSQRRVDYVIRKAIDSRL